MTIYTHVIFCRYRYAAVPKIIAEILIEIVNLILVRIQTRVVKTQSVKQTVNCLTWQHFILKLHTPLFNKIIRRNIYNIFKKIIGNRAICRCPRGWFGDPQAGGRCVDNPCNEQPCGTNADCENRQGKALCTCRWVINNRCTQ